MTCPSCGSMNIGHCTSGNSEPIWCVCLQCGISLREKDMKISERPIDVRLDLFERALQAERERDEANAAYNERLADQSITIDRLQLERDEALAQLHDCPTCGESCVECQCMRDRLQQAERERDEAQEAARRFVTVLADGDASVIERAIDEYPWLESEDENADKT